MHTPQLTGRFLSDAAIIQTNNFSTRSGTLLGSLVPVGITITMILYIRASLLQARELHADWRAASWGAANGLKGLLLDGIDREKSPSGFDIWRLHPTQEQRVAALVEPNRLFRMSWGLPFVVGFLLALLVIGGFPYLANWFVYIMGLFMAPLTEASRLYTAEPSLANGLSYWVLRGARIAWILLCLGAFSTPIILLMSSVLGTQLQKQTVVDLAAGRKGAREYVKLIIPALFLGVGMELGNLAIPLNPVALDIPGVISQNLLAPLLTMVTAWAFLVYARFVSMRVLATYIGAQYPVWRMRLIYWGWYAWLLLFFVPGLVLIFALRLDPSDPMFNDIFSRLLLFWFVSVVVLGSIAFALTWGLTRTLFFRSPPKCKICGEISNHAHPAVKPCVNCGYPLGQWLSL